ncbi:MAG: hypothetical protein GY795_44225 [Desulfobacterales bacterium]|nr:hypothetical protein [Desulfobacterales bacterium]
MSQIKEIELSDGTSIFVEAEEVSLPESTKGKPAKDLPPGAEQTGATEKIIDTMKVLKNTIRTAADTVHDGIRECKPDEWTLELNIGFKGKTSPIPVILSGESQVAMKVTAKWKKAEQK